MLPGRDRLTRDSSLTAWEWSGLHKQFNLADGHSHVTLSGAIGDVVDALPEMFRDVEQSTQSDLETRFVESLARVSGQTLSYDGCYLHYSCSTSIDMAAKALVASRVRRVAVVTPTFDNIAQLLARSGLELVPIPESALSANAQIPSRTLESVDAVFLVVPNNPTGWVPTVEQFKSLVAQISDARKALVLDFSFRHFVDLHDWDQYRILRNSPELSWMALEDTGKTWPTLELKIGAAFVSIDMRRQMDLVTGELLLNVSPLALELLTRTVAADVLLRERGGQLFTRGIVGTNREYLRKRLGGIPGVRVLGKHSTISVEWLRIDFSDAVEVAGHLLRCGVAVLPGGPFFWDSRARGRQNIRVALARDTDYFIQGVDLLARELRVLAE